MLTQRSKAFLDMRVNCYGFRSMFWTGASPKRSLACSGFEFKKRSK